MIELNLSEKQKNLLFISEILPIITESSRNVTKSFINEDYDTFLADLNYLEEHLNKVKLAVEKLKGYE